MHSIKTPDSCFQNLQDFPYLPNYQNLNISVGLTSEKWGATLYGENMLDNDNITYIFPNIFLGSRYGTLRPRTIGLRLAYRL